MNPYSVTAERFAAADVHYPSSGGARAALVLASDAKFSTIVAENTVFVEHVAPYRPGEFYLRELSALRAVLVGHDGVELLVIDGYVTLDPDGRPGLVSRRPTPPPWSTP